MIKIFRLSTVPISLNVLLKGQLKFLSNFFQVTAISSPGSDLTDVKQREGVVVKDVPLERKINVLKDFISLCKLYLYFRNEKPTIVHSITPKAGLLSMLAAKFAGVPVRMHTFTGLIFPTRTGLLQKILIWMDKLLCWAATNVYPEGQGVKKDLIKYKITDKPLKILANGNVNGIDLDYFSVDSVPSLEVKDLRRKLGITDEDFVFVFVGRLVKDKGINELVNAFGNLQSEKCKLLLVGSFEQELDPLDSETVSEIETNPRIISVGYQKDVRSYFAVSDCLVFPSYREGFPNVVLQAGAMELPSIVSDISGCNEIIIEGKNGTIIPVKNTELLQRQMLRLMNDQTFYLNLKSNSRNYIAGRYEQLVVWNALLNEYQELIRKNV